MRIKLTQVYVDDQDKALAFYTKVLGFVKKADVQNGPYRWLTVTAWAYSSRGHAFAAKGDLRSAIADLTEFLRLDPGDELVKQKLEMVKQEQAKAQSRRRPPLNSRRAEP
jgi:catechol 2,3-dioxygenase-like lactoylglutathione lyase family enzyme